VSSTVLPDFKCHILLVANLDVASKVSCRTHLDSGVAIYCLNDFCKLYSTCF
jgi:hypothetical protein